MLSAKGGGWVQDISGKIPLKNMKINCRSPLSGGVGVGVGIIGFGDLRSFKFIQSRLTRPSASLDITCLD